MKIVVLGLSITSSWGNGHATTYRALTRGLADRGHDVLFLERNLTWYAENRDLPSPSYCRAGLYEDLPHLRLEFLEDIRGADLVIVGSYVPDGIEVGDLVLREAAGVTAFYDIDTPVTLARLARGGVLYHLRYPLLALDILHEHVARDLLVFQSMLRGSAEAKLFAGDYDFRDTAHFEDPAYPRLYFVEHRYAGDPTNWWVPNRACAEAMLRAAGFGVLEHPEDEVFICQRRASADGLPDPREMSWLKR